MAMISLKFRQSRWPRRAAATPVTRLTRRLVALALGTTLVLYQAVPAVAEEGACRLGTFIQDFSDRALAIVKDPTSDRAERRNRVRGLLRANFDLDTTARLAFGRYWRAATPPQRKEYTALFSVLTMKSYFLRLEAVRQAVLARYGADNNHFFQALTIRIDRIRPIDGSDSLVVTEIPLPARRSLRIAYRVRCRKGELRIVNVIEGGVNLAVTRRAEFGSYIKAHGIEGFLALLRAQHEDGRSEVTNGARPAGARWARWFPAGAETEAKKGGN